MLFRSYHPDGTEVWERNYGTPQGSSFSADHFDPIATLNDGSWVVLQGRGGLLILDAQGQLVRRFGSVPATLFRGRPARLANGALLFMDYQGVFYRLSADGVVLEKGATQTRPDAGFALMGNGWAVTGSLTNLWFVDLEMALDAK